AAAGQDGEIFVLMVHRGAVEVDRVVAIYGAGVDGDVGVAAEGDAFELDRAGGATDNDGLSAGDGSLTIVHVDDVVAFGQEDGGAEHVLNVERFQRGEGDGPRGKGGNRDADGAVVVELCVGRAVGRVRGRFGVFADDAEAIAGDRGVRIAVVEDA